MKIGRDWYSADAQTGKIKVPIEKLTRGKEISTSTIQALIRTPLGLCQREMVSTIAQNSTLSGWTLYNPSSIAPLSPMKLVVFPDIKPFYPKEVSYSARLTFTDINGGKIERSVIPKQSDAYHRAFVIEDIVPDQTASVSMQLSAVWNDGANVAKYIENIGIKSSACEKHAFKALVLSAAKDDCYKIELLGKNGETFPSVELRVKVETAFFDRSLSFLLVTDEEGSVTLPWIPGVESVSAEIADDFKVAKTWRFRMQNCVNILPAEMNIEQQAKIVLPIDTIARVLPDSVGSFELLKVLQNTPGGNQPYFEKCSTSKVKKIGLDKNWVKSLLGMKDKKMASLEISGLDKGHYQLIYPFSNKKVDIFVHDGKEPTEDYILDKRSLKPTAASPVVMDDPIVSTNDGVTYVEYRLLAASKGAPIVSLIGSNYYNQGSLCQGIKSNKEEVFFKDSLRSYDSGKLDKDIAYAIDRKSAQPLMGCTLDRPSFLLKRELIRETKETNDKDDDFDQRVANKAMAYRDKKDKCKDQEYILSDGRVNGLYQDWARFKGELRQVKMELKDGFWVAKVPIVGDLLNYNQVSAIISTEEGLCLSAETVAPRGLKQVSKTNIALEKKLSDNTVAFEQREIKVGNECKIAGGITTRMITTRGDLFQVLGMLSGSTDLLAQWSFICHWPTLPVKKQLEYYSVFASNELHLFLYFNDKEFTDEVVKPHLRNKNKKSLVDLFILQDLPAMKEFFSPFSLTSLNFLEISLLISSFKNSEAEECRKFVQKLGQEVAQALDQKSGSRKVQKVTPTQWLERFDKVVNCQLEKLTPGVGKVPTSANCVARGLGTEYVPQMEDNVSEFAAMGVTNEVIERDWLLYSKSAIEASPFWLEFLEISLKEKKSEKFLPSHWIEVGTNPAEVLAMVSLIDLPFENNVKYQTDSAKLESTGFILEKKFVSRQQQEDINATKSSSLMISQKFFKGNEEVTILNPSTAYKMRIIVMNCNDTPLQGTLIARFLKDLFQSRRQTTLITAT
jgi:hypothetical protein